MGDMAPDRAGEKIEEEHFLDDPEVLAAFGRMLKEFANESDRGAVLVAADIVSNHLEASISDLAPSALKGKRIKNLLSYPGPLSTFAARADVAFLAEYIDETAYRSIDLLRKLRNDAAHSQEGFQLKKRRSELHQLCDLGPGTAAAVNQFASETILLTFVKGLLEVGIDLEGQLGRNPISTPIEALEYLKNHVEAKNIFEERLPKMELAFGVWLLLGLVSHKRKNLLRHSKYPE
jgi:hypothetical protein